MDKQILPYARQFNGKSFILSDINHITASDDNDFINSFIENTACPEQLNLHAIWNSSGGETHIIAPKPKNLHEYIQNSKRSIALS